MREPTGGSVSRAPLLSSASASLSRSCGASRCTPSERTGLDTHTHTYANARIPRGSVHELNCCDDEGGSFESRVSSWLVVDASWKSDETKVPGNSVIENVDIPLRLVSLGMNERRKLYLASSATLDSQYKTSSHGFMPDWQEIVHFNFFIKHAFLCPS